MRSTSDLRCWRYYVRLASVAGTDGDDPQVAAHSPGYVGITVLDAGHGSYWHNLDLEGEMTLQELYETQVDAGVSPDEAAAGVDSALGWPRSPARSGTAVYDVNEPAEWVHPARMTKAAILRRLARLKMAQARIEREIKKMKGER